MIGRWIALARLALVRFLVLSAIGVGIDAPAAAAPLAVVVRDGGDAALAIARLRGQLADLDVALIVIPGPVEPALAVQLAAAGRLAGAHGARAVVWFVIRAGGLAVAIATPGDRRLFVRELEDADASALAEAAAVVARGALRAIADGGTIGVEIPVTRPAEPPPPLRPAFGLELAVGWQIALDAGADAGAHAVAQRSRVTRGPWAASLALTFGPPLRRTSGDAAIELSRSTAAVAVERRIAGIAIGVSAGALLYHRATRSVASGLLPTPATTTAAFVTGPELRWQWRPRSGYLGIEVIAGLDVVLGAPELAVARDGAVHSLGTLRPLQPRFAAGLVLGLP